MQRCDKTTIDKIGVPSLVLMERAALAVIEEVNDGDFDLTNILILCGTGNNGGDGLAIGRILFLKGYQVTIVIIGDMEKATSEVKTQLRILESYQIKLLNKIPDYEYTTIIDAIFGSGLSRTVTGDFADAIHYINHLRKPVISVDIPSGISADTGQIMGVSIKAVKTVALAYKKLGTALYPGAYFAGSVIVKDIGIYDTGFKNRYPLVSSFELSDLSKLPERKAYSNKGTYGKVLIVAGSYNMSGAAYLVAKSAYMTGAGLVRIFTPDENREILQTLLPEAILTTYDKNDLDSSLLDSVIEWADVIGIGPGMGVSKITEIILQDVLSKSNSPIIMDADALNIIGKNPYLIKNHKQELIVTPHLKEMERLIHKSTSEISKNIINEAFEFAKEYQLVCVLKDARTIITDGKDNIILNESGNNGMAAGGSGDVLTGIITSFIAQGLSTIDSASLGVFVHGLAGDFGANEKSTYSLMAHDIIDYLPHVFRLSEKIAKDEYNEKV